MESRPYILAEANWKTVRDTDFQVAVLPWGATEAHNYHLPYATDNYQAVSVAAEAARQAWEAGVKVIVLPVIPYGVNTGQLDIELCMNMRPSTQYAVLRDIADVLVRHGIRKLVILNGHGGNNFKHIIREMSVDQPELFMCSIDWWKVGDATEFFIEPGDHAGELETSAMMHLRPELVRPLSEAGKGRGRNFIVRGFREGWATAQRQWSLVTDDTGVGDPAASSAEKGRRFLEMVTGEIGQFLVELASAEPGHYYED